VIYLGLDSSTQSLSAVLIRVEGARAEVIWEHSLGFDEACPEFGTSHGVLPSRDPKERLSPPAMWVRALDLMLAAVARSGVPLAQLRAISGAAQQHGSVYLKADGTLSRETSPIWMDSSTTMECEEIATLVGGDRVLAARTGSRATERFAGPQIRKFFKTAPAAYTATSRIHLVSSFLASQLIGADAPLDPGDASGMNLMDLATRDWWPEAVAATAPSLAGRLPAIVPSHSVIGVLAPRWQARYGLPAARVVAWTGDNSSSLVGTGLMEEGRLAVSLGTSDTVCGVMREPRVDSGGTGHVFGAPTGEYMGITVFKNGSLARERVRDDAGLDWVGFSDALRRTPPGNHGRLLFPWFEPEITPLVLVPGLRRIDLNPADGPGHVRAVVECQMMALANHSAWMGVDVKVIHATGGASENREILQVLADVFDADVYQFSGGNGSCVGASLRAWHGDATAAGEPVSWAEVVRDLAAPLGHTRVSPGPAGKDIYPALRRRYALEERRLLAHPQ
jgi:xylulokinase